MIDGGAHGPQATALSLTSLMPDQVYTDRNYRWEYGDGSD